MVTSPLGRSFFFTSIAVSLALALGPTAVTAQQVGTAASGAATADGASAFINPAAMSADDGTHVELDIGASFIQIGYVPDPVSGLSPSNPSPIGPLLTLGGYTDALGPDWRIGLTATVPETQGGAWDRDDGAAAITRYYMVNSAIVHFSVVPAVSWSPIKWLSIGLGANVTYGNLRITADKDMGITLNQAAMSTAIDSPFPYAHPDLAAPIDGTADGWGVGVVGGVFVRPIEELSFGLSVHSPVSINAKGGLTVEYPERVTQFIADTLPGATLPDLNGTFDVDLSRPWRLNAGVSAYVLPELEIGLNYSYENTSSQPNFTIVILDATSPSIEDTTKPQAYTDRHRVNLRVAYLPLPELRLLVFGSIQPNTVPDITFAPYNIDYDRYEIGLAARWHIVPELSVMLQYTHIFLIDRVITGSLHRPLPPPLASSLAAFNHPSPNGTYTGGADTLRLGLGLHL